MLERGKRIIYLCKRDTSQPTVEIFNKPVAVKVKKVPIKTNLLLEKLGQIKTEMFIALVPVETGEEFSLGDRCFVKRLPPSMYDPNCGDADFRVTGINEGIDHTEIIMEAFV